MPIVSIQQQPPQLSIKAAYRPIYFLVRATRTDGAATPPVVFCDVYVNDVFYRTLAKTHPTNLNGGDSDWAFDIQDICQELLSKAIGINAGANVEKIASLYKEITCKFRSSGYDINGFLLPEGTAPVQATGTQTAAAGDGTSSNKFFLLNATLQHASRQDLAEHLALFRKRTWDPAAWPLTHRTDKYKIGVNKSDHFPFFYAGDSEITNFRVQYRLQGGTSFGALDSAPPPAGCVPVSLPAITFPAGKVGVPYSYSFDLQGDSPFVLSNLIKPSWMVVTGPSTGRQISFSGTPDVSGNNRFVSFNISNCAGVDNSLLYKTFNVLPADAQQPACAPVGIPAANLPDGAINSPYNVTFDLTGDAPFVLSNIVKPGWMAISISGSTVSFTGNPTAAASNVSVSFTVKNCSDSNSANFSDSINVAAAADHNPFVINNSGGSIQITSNGIVYPSAPTTNNFIAGTSAGTTIFISYGEKATYLMEFRSSIGSAPLYSITVAVGQEVFLSSNPDNAETGIDHINYITIT